MKYNYLKYSLASLLLLCGITAVGALLGSAGNNDFAVDLRDANGGILTADECSVSETVSFGLAFDESSKVVRVAADAENTLAVITGKTGNNHGLQNFSATVPVQGSVKITMSTCSWEALLIWSNSM